MKTIKAFLLGVWEFRGSVTTSHDDEGLAYAYDCGREFAHRATLRAFDH